MKSARAISSLRWISMRSGPIKDEIVAVARVRERTTYIFPLKN
jgi:hypothetical protein